MYNTHNATHQRHTRRSVSTRRTAAYERPSYDSALPEEFFDSRVRLAIVCPETALMYAVLEDAFLCFYMQFETEQPFVQRARRLRVGFSAMTLAGSFPSCPSAQRPGWNPSTYGQSLSIGPPLPPGHSPGKQIVCCSELRPPKFRDPTISDRPGPLE